MDKGMFIDNLIGQTVIDVENRLFANLYYLNDFTLSHELKKAEKILKDKKIKDKKLKERMKKKK